MAWVWPILVTVHFSSAPWLIRSSGGHEGQFSLFCRRPLSALLAWAEMFTLWCCPSSISCAGHGVAHTPRCPEGWFWRRCRGVWHTRTMQVSVSWQLPEEVPVDPQGSWSCFAPSRWSCTPSKRCGEVFPRHFGFEGLDPFFSRVSKQSLCFTAIEEDGDDKRLVELSDVLSCCQRWWSLVLSNVFLQFCRSKDALNWSFGFVLLYVVVVRSFLRSLACFLALFWMSVPLFFG